MAVGKDKNIFEEMNDIGTGDHVVCINDTFPAVVSKLYKTLPKKDSHYVVRDVRMGIRLDCKTGDASVLLVGIVNPCADSKARHERGFSIDRFRKLDELKTETTKEVSVPVRRQKVMVVGWVYGIKIKTTEIDGQACINPVLQRLP